jgi:Tfp pilus assembly protein PilF
MKTKPIAFTLPIIAVLYEFSFFNKVSGLVPEAGNVAGVSQNSNMRRFIYLFPILLTILIIPLSMICLTASSETIIQDVNNITRETPNISRTDYLFTQLRVIISYLRLLLFPVNQNVDYRYPVYHSFFDLPVMISFFVILSIVGLSFYLFYRSRPAICKAPSGKPNLKLLSLRLASFGIMWFFITLLVESSIVPIKDVIVEHRLYLPSAGFFIASISLTDYFIKNSGLKRFLIIFIVVLLSISAYSRNSLWNDPQKMWEDVVSKAPNNVRAYTELGAVFRDEGRYAEANMQFEKALKINKNYPLTYYNLGEIQYRLGDYDKALKYFQKTLTFQLPPLLHTDTLNSIGMTYSEMGDVVNAVSAFKEAIRRYPGVISPYNNLGRQYIKMGEADLAIEILEKAMKIRETPHLYYNLSQAYALKGDNEKRRLFSQRAIQLGENYTQ